MSIFTNRSVKATALALIAALILALTGAMSVGCSDETSYAEINPEELADALVGGIAFDDELVRLADAIVQSKYTAVSGAVSAVVYAGSGATAEEIIVAEAADEAAAEEMYAKLGEYNTKRIAIYSDYAPAEAARLEGSVIVVRGKYVAYCSTSDTAAAQKIIDEAFEA